VWGTWAYETDGVRFTWGDRVGSIAGTFWGESRDGFVTLKFIGQGTGDYAGMKLLGTADVPPPPPLTEHPVEAVILNPQG
jgi:hypothetical protein